MAQLASAGVPFSVGAAGERSATDEAGSLARTDGLPAVASGLSWRVLAPGAGARPGSTNAASLIVLAEAGGVSVLLLGDSGQAEQAALLRAYPDLGAEVLKVGHHGSRDRETGLGAAVGARLALVSVGAENRYGHPNPDVLSELARAGIPLLRTDDHGSLAVTPGDANGPGVWVERAEASVSGRR